MIGRFAKLSTRFARDQRGSAVVPFALWTPVFLMLILSSVELGTVTIRSTLLERAMDKTVRDVRLGTAGITTHAGLKQAICDQAAVLPNCTDTLQLEMIRLDMRAWSQPPAAADCVDTSEPVTPQRTFQNGGGGEMMFLRACYKYRPITPAGTLSSSLAKDAQGFTALIASSAFVTEPF